MKFPIWNTNSRDSRLAQCSCKCGKKWWVIINSNYLDLTTTDQWQKRTSGYICIYHLIASIWVIERKTKLRLWSIAVCLPCWEEYKNSTCKNWLNGLLVSSCSVSGLYLVNAYVAHNCRAYFWSVHSEIHSLLLFCFKDASSVPLPVVLAVYSCKYWAQLCLACVICLACGSWLSPSSLCFWLWEKSLTCLRHWFRWFWVSGLLSFAQLRT